MKQTEVYVEQVIIGFCVLVIVYVLITGRWPALPESGFVAGAVVLGASYVVGILYDRCADSLLDRIDKWNRIRFAAEFTGKTEWCSDPFPEYNRKLTSGESATYLNSRIRLMRAMTTLVPAIAIAVVVERESFYRYAPREILIATVACYLLVPLLSFPLTKVPRTDKGVPLNVYVAKRKHLWITPNRFLEPALIAWALLSVEVMVIAWRRDREAGWGILAAQIMVTLLAAWSWLRISNTFMEFLRALPSSPTEPECPAGSGTSPRSPARSR